MTCASNWEGGRVQLAYDWNLARYTSMATSYSTPHILPKDFQTVAHCTTSNN